MAVALLAACTGSDTGGKGQGQGKKGQAGSSPTRTAQDPTKPNIVFVLTDDLSMNLLQYMPAVQQMQKDGASFSHYFVTDSLCCPSRASIFTGRYPHNTGSTGTSGTTAATSPSRRSDWSPTRWRPTCRRPATAPR